MQRLIFLLRQRHPSWRIFLTSLTPSGFRLAQEKMGRLVEVTLIPVDVPFSLRRFFRRVNPRLLVLTESEFWPNLLRLARKSGVPVVLINGRISARSFSRLKKIRRFFGRWLQGIEHFLVQTEREKERLLALGLPIDKVIVTGNLKSDVQLPLFSEEEKLNWKKRLGLDLKNKVVTAGSTHRGEETIFLEAFSAARKKKPELRLIIAPRHPERCGEVAEACASFSLKWERWSAWKSEKKEERRPALDWDVLLVDTLGDLPFFYALADLTFIGGSLIPWGGHNLLEPAFYGKSIIFGPYMDNFSALAQEFLQQNAAKLVASREELTQALLSLEEPEFVERGAKARSLLASLQGATEKTLMFLEGLMAKM